MPEIIAEIGGLMRKRPAIAGGPLPFSTGRTYPLLQSHEYIRPGNGGGVTCME